MISNVKMDSPASAGMVAGVLNGASSGGTQDPITMVCFVFYIIS